MSKLPDASNVTAPDTTEGTCEEPAITAVTPDTPTASVYDATAGTDAPVNLAVAVT